MPTRGKLGPFAIAAVGAAFGCGGDGVPLEPASACRVEVTPTAVNLGEVEIGRTAQGSVEVRNLSSRATCAIGPTRWSVLEGVGDAEPSGSDPAPPPTILSPDRALAISVGFRPREPGPFRAVFELETSDRESPRLSVELTGQAVGTTDSALLVVPNAIDFGEADAPCSARGRTLSVYNATSEPLEITELTIDGPVGVFTVRGFDGLPVPIAARSAVTLSVGFDPPEVSDFDANLRIGWRAGARRDVVDVPIRGQGRVAEPREETFGIRRRVTSDVLLVVDPSRSMSDEQRHWARNWSDFIDAVERLGSDVDLNVAFTTTDFETEAGRFLPPEGDIDRVLSFSGGAVPRDAFIDRVTVGASREAPVRALDAMYGALSPPLVRGANAGFLRPEPALSLVVVTDGDDASEQVPDFVMNYLLLLKGAGPVRTFLSTVSGGSTGCASDFGCASPAPRLAELADIYGGAALSICDPDWGRDLAAHLLGGPDTWAPTRLFLSEEPVEGTLEAFVDGERWPSVDEEGRTRWQYDAGRNAVAIWV